MIRNNSLDEISDGRLYDINDMVKADCGDCKGCSDCCHGMGTSIILDPYDIYRMTKGTGVTFEQLLATSVELNVIDGMILPNLKMSGAVDKCYYLDSDGRCSIHTFRPGICRIFPLGRYYENDDYKYILQIHECSKKNRTKIKVSKWIDIPDISENKKYILAWHDFIRDFTAKLKTMDDALLKKANLIMLDKLYIQKYDDTDFYGQFYKRTEELMTAY